MPSTPKWLGNTMENLLGSKMPLMKIEKCCYISNSIKKIIFKGDLSGMHFHIGYAVIIRVSDTEFRNYTPSFYDIEKGILEIIFHLHGHAPGAHFIDRLQVGDTLRISMPRGKKMYDKQVNRQFFFGDETSLSFACSLYPRLIEQNHAFQFYFELDADNQSLPEQIGLKCAKVFIKQNTFSDPQLLNDLPLFSDPDWIAWQQGNFILTGNAKSVQNFRRVLKQHQVLNKNILLKAYWAEGKAGL